MCVDCLHGNAGPSSPPWYIAQPVCNVRVQSFQNFPSQDSAIPFVTPEIQKLCKSSLVTHYKLHVEAIVVDTSLLVKEVFKGLCLDFNFHRSALPNFIVLGGKYPEHFLKTKTANPPQLL